MARRSTKAHTAPAKGRAKSRPKPKFRASWRGQLRFGLVSFEVQAINAEIKENAEVHFHLLHEPDHERIHFAKVCPKHGEVPNDEIVEGYEYAKDKYVEFEKEELDTLRTEKERSLSIDAFVSSDAIDPIYFDGRMYYLIPSGTGASEPYSLLESAMEKKKRWGVGQVVFSGREQLAIVRPMGGVLVMAMLTYDAEIRKPDEITKLFTRAHSSSRMLELAEQLMGKWQDRRFDLGDYTDRYRAKVKEAIEAKEKGIELAPPEEEEPHIVNLLDALRQSVSDSTIGHRRQARKQSKPKNHETNGHSKKPKSNSHKRRHA